MTCRSPFSCPRRSPANPGGTVTLLEYARREVLWELRRVVTPAGTRVEWESGSRSHCTGRCDASGAMCAPLGHTTLPAGPGTPGLTGEEVPDPVGRSVRQHGRYLPGPRLPTAMRPVLRIDGPPDRRRSRSTLRRQ